MRPRDVKEVRKFYKEALWKEGMKQTDKVSDEELEYLQNTMLFATWKLNNSFEDVVVALKKVIKKINFKKN